MATYKYQCDNEQCQNRFEVTELMAEMGKHPIPCPKCGKFKNHRVITTAPTIKFNGTGFYVNDKDK